LSSGNPHPKAGCSIVFANGTLSFVLVHHRPDYLFDSHNPGCPTEVSTIRLANNITWRKFERSKNVKALVLIFCDDYLAEVVPIPHEKTTFDRRRKHKCDLGDLADLLRDHRRELGK
jgi:hypothetical protein